MVDGQGKPLLFRLTGANGDEREQAINLLRECRTRLRGKPKVLQADRGYDSQKVRMYAENICGIYTSIPQREYDAARRGQYRKPKESRQNNRWVVERTFAWIYKKFRRLACRWERKTVSFKGLLSAAICFFWLQSFVG